MKYFIVLFLVPLILSSASSQSITGIVYGSTDGEEMETLVGANIYWKGSLAGVLSEADGTFSIEPSEIGDTLMISYTGFASYHRVYDGKLNFIRVMLSADASLPTVVVEEKSASTQLLDGETRQTIQLDQREIKKAACCNLSESFETNASVDVNFADAVSGQRKIRMLGLDGVYALITLENIPSIRGLSSSFGLNAVPGSWIQSIQLSKGVGSVVNGYEALTGQINVELKKPMNAPKLHVNLYGNQAGRYEMSAESALEINNKWSTNFMAHFNHMGNRLDPNKDGFLDIPLSDQINLMNRWKYQGNKYEGQISARFAYDRRQGGQLEFKPEQERSIDLPWGMEVENKHLELFAKMGNFFTKEEPHKSTGMIAKFSYTDIDASYGLKDYSGSEIYIYANLIHQNSIGDDERHLLKRGLSFFYNQFSNNLFDNANLSWSEEQLGRLDRTEIVPGAFTEYTYDPNKRFTLIAGARADYHNLFGAFFTPRLHLRYGLSRRLTWRFAMGSGMRTANPYVDNSRIMVSSRLIEWTGDLQPEKAWNIGSSLNGEYNLFNKNIVIIADVYHTRFTNQFVVDFDRSSEKVYLGNLDGRSYATVLQGDIEIEILPGLNLRNSLKFQDVRMTLAEKVQSVPFVAQSQWFTNLAYATENEHWRFDVTALRTDPGRVPERQGENTILEAFDPEPFWRINGQITFVKDDLEIYLGGENLGGFTQSQPIIGADNPFGRNFDAGSVWGPIFGRIIYLGVRFSIY